MGHHGAVKTLHVGRARAVTTYDAKHDVCWLLAYGETHATGETRDAFRDFENLHTRDELLPTADDYESLERISTAAQIDLLKEFGAEVYAEAREHPGDEINKTVGLRDDYEGQMLIVIDLEVIDGAEAEQGWIIFTVPPQTGLGEEQLYDVLDSILPERVDLESLTKVATVRDRAVRYNELAWTWSCYPEDERTAAR